jgi:hypothetical protein
LKKDWVPFILYSVLALAVLGCLLPSGYVLTLDLYFSPTPHYSQYFWGLNEWAISVNAAGIAATPFFLFVQLLAKIIPAWVVEKFILFLLLFLSGWGAHRLISNKSPGCYFVGLLYMINPFVYSRFMAGQWGVLWAYAWMPFAIGAFIKLLRHGSWKNTIVMAVLATLIGMVQVQGFLLLFIACFIIFVFKVILDRSQAKAFQSVKWTAAAAGVFSVLNLYWLFPLFTSAGTILTQLNQADQLSFIPRNTSEFGILFNIISMHGFWRDGYIYAKDIIPYWWILFIVILFLAVYGFISKTSSSLKPSRLKPDKNEISPGSIEAAQKYAVEQWWIVISFAIIGVTGFILALGVATEYTRPFFVWLWNKFSFFRVFRDSQKFVALLCLAYAYLGGLGINELAGILKQQIQRLPRIALVILIALALAAPLAYSFTMFGFHGQIGVTDYPEEWYEVNDYLNQDKEDINVLFLPWHMYMDYSWLTNKDKRLINPSQQFFDKPVIAGDNIEVPGIYSQSLNPISKYIEFLLPHGNEVNNLGELLAPLNIKYIILVDEADYTSFDFLYRQEDLRVEMQKSGIVLFRNLYPTTRIYGVDSVVNIKNLDEYLELSRLQDVMSHLYVIGNGPGDDGNGRVEKINSKEKNPVRYIIDGTARQYTIFTVPQNVSTHYWEYNGREPVFHNLGFMPAFISSPDGGEMVYTRFYRAYLPGYIISSLALCLIVYCYIRPPKRRKVLENAAIDKG